MAIGPQGRADEAYSKVALSRAHSCWYIVSGQRRQAKQNTNGKASPWFQSTSKKQISETRLRIDNIKDVTACKNYNMLYRPAEKRLWLIDGFTWCNEMVLHCSQLCKIYPFANLTACALHFYIWGVHEMNPLATLDTYHQIWLSNVFYWLSPWHCLTSLSWRPTE